MYPWSLRHTSYKMHLVITRVTIGMVRNFIVRHCYSINVQFASVANLPSTAVFERPGHEVCSTGE